jgi:hypothetical protein
MTLPKETPMIERCALGAHHHWGAWGQFIPVWPEPSQIWATYGVTPTSSGVEAYRWRRCECGAMEREAHSNGGRRLFSREEAA